MTGIVYDDHFATHECLWDENYSENPRRYTSILDRCNSLGLIDRCVRIEARRAEKRELLSKHTAEHIDLLESTENYGVNELERISSKYDSIYIHPFTYKQSLLAAGSSIELVKAVVDGRVQNGMALVRPPGHHAMISEYCGYCFFNNVAIAAQYLLDKTTVRKILIVDWDIHHGQATQRMFYDDPRVLYFSVHRYEHGRFWPNLKESDFDHVGNGNGTGFNVNVPLNETAMENKDYMAVVHYLLIPLAIEFSPELIIVSSGFDSAVGDPKGEMLVTPACYAHITRKLMSVTRGKVIAILEGGYYLTSLAESAALTLRALLGDPCPAFIESLQRPCKSVMETICNVIHAHKNYWQCFQYSVLYDEKYSPEIRYECNELQEKPETYQTRNMYPKIDTTASFDILLNDIITKTKLFNPRIRMGIIFKTVDRSNRNIKKNDIYRYLNSRIGHLHIILKKRQSTIEDLNLVYTTKYINEVLNRQKYIHDESNANNTGNGSIENNSIFIKFCISVGSLLQVIDLIFENEIGSGICTSLSTIASLNEDARTLNASIIGANYAINKHFLKRVLIIELNENVLQVHSNDRIMVISLCRLLNTQSSPSNRNNKHADISWSKEKLNDADFTTMMQHLILPIAYEYNPELIIVSINFYSIIDKTHNGGIQIPPNIYGHLIQWLSTLANGRLVICDQGNNSVHRKECLLECCKALVGEPLSKLYMKKHLSLDTKETLRYNIRNHISIWQSLPFSNKNFDIP